ncbi:unnamed protein product [Plutella xylostella]|uniref:(diamondback moth) hypothetical protein n=1 Tax=Plutella xylostella TaxID=51655 RepID=A0A8S4CWG2_PLUXY|nr:unnamed protein product [Plutella xylostella]
MSFITFRRRQRTQSESKPAEDENNASKSTLDGTTSSMPSFSEEEDDIIKELKTKIEILNRDLKAAHDEITNLNLENTELKNTVQSLQKENNMYKKVTNSLKNDLVTPKKKREKSTSTKKTPKLQSLPSDISANENVVEACNSTSISTSVQVHATGSKYEPNISKPTDSIKTKSKPNKIVIISTNKNNKIMEIAEETYPNKYKLSHLLYPNIGTKGLLQKLEQNDIKSLTLHDMCIILLGEEDFTTTQNYFDLVLHIRHVTQSIENTNILICLPTYKYGEHKMMYNWRIETFNNLMYFDVLSNKHVFLMDPNANLSYNIDMYNKYSGQINDMGMRVVFKDILQATDDIYYKLNNLDTGNEPTKPLYNNDNDLFRI